MRANSRRDLAFSFGQLLEHYDAGRPRLSSEFVDDVVQRLGTSTAGRHLEVGAGTGQLTGALLTRCEQVTALEPSAELAQRLGHRYGQELRDARLEIRQAPLEAGDPEEWGTFGHIWSSDAWHWVDPTVGYQVASSLLHPGGALIATWGLPVVADAALAQSLNEVYRRSSPDLIRDPDTHLEEMEPVLAGGREDINRSGCFTIIEHWITESISTVPAASFVDWQLSYAHIASMTATEQQDLAEGIAGLLSGAGREQVPVRLWRYTVASTSDRDLASRPN